MKRTIVCLCGSTKFKTEFEQANKEQTLAGKIVLSCGMFNHADCLNIDEDTKDMLDQLHLDKIDISDEIYIVNKGGYIGKSTRREIEHAKRTGKTVRYMFSDYD